MRSAAPQVGGTITPYHMILTRTDWFGHGLKPYMYVMPVIKTATGRCGVAHWCVIPRAKLYISLVTGCRRCISTPPKVSTNGILGMFNALAATETYAKVFEEEGALDKLEAFASLNGPKHYKMPPNEERITLEKSPWTAPEEVKVAGPTNGGDVPSYRGGDDDRMEGGESAWRFPTKRRMVGTDGEDDAEVDAVRFMTDKPFIYTSGWASPVYT